MFCPCFGVIPSCGHAGLLHSRHFLFTPPWCSHLVGHLSQSTFGITGLRDQDDLLNRVSHTTCFCVSPSLAHIPAICAHFQNWPVTCTSQSHGMSILKCTEEVPMIPTLFVFCSIDSITKDTVALKNPNEVFCSMVDHVPPMFSVGFARMPTVWKRKTIVQQTSNIKYWQQASDWSFETFQMAPCCKYLMRDVVSSGTPQAIPYSKYAFKVVSSIKAIVHQHHSVSPSGYSATIWCSLSHVYINFFASSYPRLQVGVWGLICRVYRGAVHPTPHHTTQHNTTQNNTKQHTNCVHSHLKVSNIYIYIHIYTYIFYIYIHPYINM